MDDLDPYRDAPPPPDDEPVVPAVDAADNDHEKMAFMGGFRGGMAGGSSSRGNSGLEQGGRATGTYQSKGAHVSAQVRALCSSHGQLRPYNY